MKCDLHAIERDGLFIEIFPRLNIREKSDINHNFKLVMGSRDPEVLKPLSKFIYLGFQKREHIMVA